MGLWAISIYLEQITLLCKAAHVLFNCAALPHDLIIAVLSISSSHLILYFF